MTSISVVGNDNVDSFGTGSSHGGYHQQQLHQVLVDGGACRLDDEDLLGPNVVLNFDTDLSIVESSHFDTTQLNFQYFCNFLGEGFVGVPCEDDHVLSDFRMKYLNYSVSSKDMS